MGEVETLTPIRLRYTGEVIDLTTAYDDQNIIHTEPVQVDRTFIDTTVGRVILNDQLPEGMPYINGLLKKKGIGALVNYCYLQFGLEVTVKMLDEVKSAWASCSRPAPACRSASTTWSSPTARRPW